MAALVAKANTEVFSRNITVGFALERFCALTDERIKRRQAFLPSGALMKNRLVSLGPMEVGMPDALLSRRFQLSLPTVRYLMGEDELADDVAKVARLENPSVSLQIIRHANMTERQLNVKCVFPTGLKFIGTILRIKHKLKPTENVGMRRIKNPKYKSH